MGFFMSDINFCNTKEQLNHLGEVVTGKVDGSPTGADIDTSTLPYTGQVRKTLPSLEAEYLEAIRSAGGVTLGVWASGVTTFTQYNEYAVYNGIPYKPRTTTTLPYVAQGVDPTLEPDASNVQPYVELSSGSLPNYTDILYRDSGGNSAYANMVAGVPIMLSVGDKASTGAGSWKKISNNGDSSDFIPLNGVWAVDFTSETLQEILSINSKSFDLYGFDVTSDISVSGIHNKSIKNLEMTVEQATIAFNDCSDIRFKRCSFDKDDQDRLANEFGSYYDPSKNELEPQWSFITHDGCINVTYEKCSFIKYGDRAVFSENSYGVRAVDCYFGNCSFEVGAFNYAKTAISSTRITGCIFNNTTDIDCVKSYGYSDDIVIDKNTFYNYGARTAKSGVIYHDAIDTFRRGQRVTITNNTMHTNNLSWSGIQCKNIYRDSGISSDNIENNQQINISKNFISGTNQYCILVNKFDERVSPVFHVFEEYVKYNNISSNVLSDSTVYAIWGDGLAYTNINSNQFKDNAEGIRIRKECQSVNINSNMFHRQSVADIRLDCSNGANSLSIKGNNFNCDDGLIPHISVEGVINDSDISGNIFKGGKSSISSAIGCSFNNSSFVENIISEMSGRPWELSGSDLYSGFTLSRNIVSDCALDAFPITQGNGIVGYYANTSNFLNSVIKRGEIGDMRMNQTTNRPEWWSGTDWIYADGTSS